MENIHTILSTRCQARNKRRVNPCIQQAKSGRALLQSTHGGKAAAHPLDGECALLEHSPLLVCHPSLCRILAKDEPLAVPGAASALDRHHPSARLGGLALARYPALFVAMDVGACRTAFSVWVEDLCRHSFTVRGA